MALDTFEIQPGEIEPLNFDFSDVIPGDNIIATVLSITAVAHGDVPAAPALGISGITSSGKIAQCKVAPPAGSSGESYTVTCKVRDNNVPAGLEYELEGVVSVSDITETGTGFKAEDGTGLADANSYNSVAEFKAYWHLAGKHDVAHATDEKIRGALVMATRYMDATYGTLLASEPTVAAQGLLWPRLAFTNPAGFTYAANVVPMIWKRAVNEVARIALTKDLFTSSERGPVKREKAMSFEIEYAGAAPIGVTFPIVERMLAQLLPLGSTGSGLVELVRG
jgi:hypothetical protein